MTDESALPKKLSQRQARHQRETRLTILEAARRLLQRTSAEELALSDVAAEAGLATEEVGLHFHGKNELLLSLAADALSNLARVARNDVWTEDGAASQEPIFASGGTLGLLKVVETIVTPVGSPSAQPDAATPEAAVPHPTKYCGSGSLKGPFGRQREPNEGPDRRQQPRDGNKPAFRGGARAEKLSGLRKKVLLSPEPNAALKDVAPSEVQRGSGGNNRGISPIARLGRRVQLTEQTVTELSERHNASERNGNAAMSAREGIRTSREHIDKPERDQIAAAGELRALVLEAGLLATPKSAAPAPEADALEPDPVPVPRAAEWSPDNADETDRTLEVTAMDEDGAILTLTCAGKSETATATDDRTDRELVEAYLLAARRAANEATGENATHVRRTLFEWRRMFDLSRARVGRFKHKHVVIAGVALPLLMLLAARVAFVRGFADATLPAPAAHRQESSPAAHTAPLGQADAAATTNAADDEPWMALVTTGNPKAALLAGLEAMKTNRPAEDSEAFQLLSRAANSGEVLAQYWLGTLYARGRGVRSDSKVAADWFEKAAQQGNVKAMNSLAHAYAIGEGRAADMTEAAHWYAKAAVAGYLQAQFNLAVLYEQGLGVPQSLIDAYMWYAVAASQGDSESEARIAVLGMQLSSAELKAAQSAAETFKPAALDAAANNPPDPIDGLGG